MNHFSTVAIWGYLQGDNSITPHRPVPRLGLSLVLNSCLVHVLTRKQLLFEIDVHKCPWEVATQIIPCLSQACSKVYGVRTAWTNSVCVLATLNFIH